jgi:hypothetical protein
LAWWINDAARRNIENEPLVTDWEVFKDMIKELNATQLVMRMINRAYGIISGKGQDNPCKSSPTLGREPFSWESLSKAQRC